MESLAFCHSLRGQLRNLDVSADVAGYLPPSEQAPRSGTPGPDALLRSMGRRIGALRASGRIDGMDYRIMDERLSSRTHESGRLLFLLTRKSWTIGRWNTRGTKVIEPSRRCLCLALLAFAALPTPGIAASDPIFTDSRVITEERRLGILETKLASLQREINLIEDMKAIERLQQSWGHYVSEGMAGEAAALFSDSPCRVDRICPAGCVSGTRAHRSVPQGQRRPAGAG